MRKLFSIILIAAIAAPMLLLYGCGGGKDSLPEPPGYITAIGKALYTAREGGEKIWLRGVNAGGWLVTEDWMCPTSLDNDLRAESGMFELWDALEESLGAQAAEEAYNLYRDTWWTEEDFDNCKAIGFNSIRLPFTWRDLENKDYTPKENGFDRLDWFITECAKREIYVIIDLHGAHGSQNGRHHSGDTRTGGDLYGNEENMDRTEALWVRVAERYKDNKWVAGYDLLNEPEAYPGGTMNRQTPQWEYFDRLYKAIRAVDQNHLIMMCPTWELYNLPDPKRYGWENVAYAPHFYEWNDSNNFEKQKKFLEDKVRHAEGLNYNIPVFVGEFTFFNNAESWIYALNLFKELGWGFSIWSYKVYGEGSSWGLYTAPNRTLDNVVTRHDDMESIRRKWGSLQTSASFTPNKWLIDTIKQVLL